MLNDDPRENAAILKWNCAMLLKRKNRALKFRIFAKWKGLIPTLNIPTHQTNKNAAMQLNSRSQSNKELEDELSRLLQEQKRLETVSAQLKTAVTQRVQHVQQSGISKIMN